MSLLTISWVRNESDIIEVFVRHHCRIAQRMIIIDNGSRDNTLEILRSLQAEGLPLSIASDPSRVHAQAEAVNAALHAGLEAHDPAWILPLDADEFLVTTTGEEATAALSRTPRACVSLLPWRTYVPLPDHEEEGSNAVQRLTHRRAVEYPAYTKILVPRAVLSPGRPREVISFGGHVLLHADAPHVLHDTFALAHFPVRSARQIAVKVIGGWLHYMANPLRQPGWNYQWKTVYDRLRRGMPLTPRELSDVARMYAQTGFPPDAERSPLLFDPLRDPPAQRFLPRPLDPQSFLYDTAEEMADFACELQRGAVAPVLCPTSSS